MLESKSNKRQIEHDIKKLPLITEGVKHVLKRDEKFTLNRQPRSSLESLKRSADKITKKND